MKQIKDELPVKELPKEQSLSQKKLSEINKKFQKLDIQLCKINESLDMLLLPLRKMFFKYFETIGAEFSFEDEEDDECNLKLKIRNIDISQTTASWIVRFDYSGKTYWIPLASCATVEDIKKYFDNKQLQKDKEEYLRLKAIFGASK
jgi:hypothetical protein